MDALGQSDVTVELGRDYPELRDAVSRVCESYPGEYWRGLEANLDYPSAFVKELTQGGFLSALIPEQYGGTGLPLSCHRIEQVTFAIDPMNTGASSVDRERKPPADVGGP